jgi:hypothetical protein
MTNDHVSQSVLGLIGELGQSGGLPLLAPHLGVVLAELPLHLRRRAPFVASNAIWAFYEIANAALAIATADGDAAAAAAAVEMVAVVRERLPLMAAAVDRLVADLDVDSEATLEENISLFRDVAGRVGVL